MPLKLLFAKQLSIYKVVSLPSLATCKSESLGQLIVSNMAAVNGGNRTNNTEKKSLASKLSGTLNRNNSGEYSLSLQIPTKYRYSIVLY